MSLWQWIKEKLFRVENPKQYRVKGYTYVNKSGKTVTVKPHDRKKREGKRDKTNVRC